MTALKVLVCVLVVAVSVFAQERRAIAYVEPTSNSPYAISGSVSFIQLGDSVVTVAVDIRGLPDGDYAIHVHEFGDLTDISGASAGPHFIGNGSATHGCPGTDIRHEGDMGSWTSEFGAIFQQKYLDLLQLSGNYSIVGRAVVVHQLVDSCSGESGNAGKRYAFGTIGIQNFHESQASQDYAAPLLVAKLYGTTNCNFCSGFVYFYQNINESTITVTAYVNGLVGNTVHGLHIHQYGDLTFGDGSYLGVHYNPTGNLHGLPIDDDRHAGDLGNIQNYDSTTGIAWYQYNTTIIESLANITGRGVIVHELQDNGRGFGCNTGTGNSGVRYIAGVIGIASNTTSVPAVPISIDNTWVDVDCEPLPVYTTGSTINGFTSHFTSELIVFTSVSSSSVLTISLLFSLIWVLMM